MKWLPCLNSKTLAEAKNMEESTSMNLIEVVPKFNQCLTYIGLLANNEWQYKYINSKRIFIYQS